MSAFAPIIRQQLPLTFVVKFDSMRKHFDQDPFLGTKPISEVRIPTKSRDELAPVLMGLQHIFTTPELNRQVFEILEGKILVGKNNTGRPGMGLWEIFVLATVRNCLNANYDRLHDQANYHSLIRGIMGVDTPFREGKEYSLSSIKDNVSLLDEQTLIEINELIVGAGHRLLKKKDGTLSAKIDSFVVETNVHFPTDLNLLWDSGRKCIDICAACSQKFGLGGWRKHRIWHRDLKKHYRKASGTARSGGANKPERVNLDVGAYLSFCRKLGEKVVLSRMELSLLADPVCYALEIELKYYHSMLLKHIDLVERRLIKGEKIPHQEKLFSIFEPHTQWISKGKLHTPVELGRNLLIATDHFHFILYHKVMEGPDVHQVVEATDYLIGHYGKIESLSFDRGFYSQLNKEYLAKKIPLPVLPKKGKKNKREVEEEAAAPFKKAKRKHSAVESNIHQLECNGLDRCPDKGEQNFKRYCALAVVSYNLHRLGSSLLEAQRKKERRVAKKAA